MQGQPFDKTPCRTPIMALLAGRGSICPGRAGNVCTVAAGTGQRTTPSGQLSVVNAPGPIVGNVGSVPVPAVTTPRVGATPIVGNVGFVEAIVGKVGRASVGKVSELVGAIGIVGKVSKLLGTVGGSVGNVGKLVGAVGGSVGNVGKLFGAVGPVGGSVGNVGKFVGAVGPVAGSVGKVGNVEAVGSVGNDGKLVAAIKMKFTVQMVIWFRSVSYTCSWGECCTRWQRDVWK